MTIKKARREIEELIYNPGQYGHNIVSATLRIIAREYGYGEANKIIDDLDLTDNMGIPKYWPAIDMLKGKDPEGFPKPTATKYNVHPTGNYGTKSI